MPSVIDDDTLAAVVARWKDDPQLRSIIPEPHAGRLKSPQPTLYCQVESKLDRRECASTGGAWNDYRLVTLTIVGIKAAVVEALARAEAVFSQEVTLTYPSGDRFVQWWPLEEGGLSEDPDRKEGQDQWRGTVQGRVWSVRVSS